MTDMTTPPAYNRDETIVIDEILTVVGKNALTALEPLIPSMEDGNYDEFFSTLKMLGLEDRHMPEVTVQKDYTVDITITFTGSISVPDIEHLAGAGEYDVAQLIENEIDGDFDSAVDHLRFFGDVSLSVDDFEEE
jgi:hypothetical protein